MADAEAKNDAFEPHDLAGFFTTPRWLREMGTTAWFAVGIVLIVVAAISLLALTRTIVMPVITAAVVAAVASPVVAWLSRHRVNRAIAAVMVLLGLVVLSTAMAVIVIGGITDQLDAVRAEVSAAKDEAAGWLNDVGVERGTTDEAKESVSSGVDDSIAVLLDGVVTGLSKLSSLAFFLALTALSLFFLLMDGPKIRHWAEGHMRVPRSVASQISGRVLQSLRGYFAGVTFVAAFNAAVVSLGALILGVPLIGTIAAVTFVGAYIPYLGAWGAGAFSVVMALGGAGPEAAAGMVVVQLLANGILQQMVQPFAMGTALGIHPLAVLIVTIGGGALFGTAGLILAAPLTAAATRIAEDLRTEPAAPDAPSY